MERNRLEDLIANILEIYSLEYVLEDNDLTEQDALMILFEEGHIRLPEKLPL